MSDTRSSSGSVGAILKEARLHLLSNRCLEADKAIGRALAMLDAAQGQSDCGVDRERDMWVAAAGGEAEIGKREAAKVEALYAILNEAQAALVEFKRWCRTDISRKSWDALHALEDVLSRPAGPNITLSDLASDLQQASPIPSTNSGGEA